LVFVPDANGLGTPYAAFSFLADDGFYASGPAQIQVNIGLPTEPHLGNPVVISSREGQYLLQLYGDQNASYSLWASTNLTDWLRIGAALETSPGQYELLDSAGTNYQQRFYRASAP
jgi:hypothetical protein